MSGQADIAPDGRWRRAAGARHRPLRRAADGWTEVSTVALLDGPFSGGRVTGLRIPISGRFGAGGALRFGERCLDTGFASLTAGSLRLGPTRLPLCPAGGAILQRRAGRRLSQSASPRATSGCAGAWASRRSRSMRR